MKRSSPFLRVLALLLILSALLNLGGCKKKTDSKANSSEKLPTVLNQTEYVIYQNLFYNKKTDDYVGKTVTKTGTFIRLYDRWNDMTRYYVWGYMDATKCCDWQWEFVPKDPGSLPPDGSLVEMKGKLVYNENALDKYWFTDASVKLKTEFTGQKDFDVDLSTMDSTLERVQLMNLMKDPDLFNGKSVLLYGRVKSLDSIQHPYYDNAWTLKFSADTQIPAIGTMVLINGTWEDDHLVQATLTPTKDY